MTTTKTTSIEWIATDTLHFDHVNPRLAEYGIADGLTDEEILDILWDAMDVQELVQSISASGFFEHEALIVARENNRNVVIEGNRRLAAVKVLRSPKLAAEKGWHVPKLSATQHKDLDTLPVLFETREGSWRYLGFKHVNGPAKWGSYAKAVYIADVHRRYSIPLVEIANQIGDRHRTVQRLFRGLMVLEQAEREKVFDREDRFNNRLSFSHLYTGLDYDGISSFLGVASKEDESNHPVPKDKVRALGELCGWLYGSRKEKREPVVRSQNPHLRQLNAVVANREAVAALRAGAALEKAFEVSLPPKAVFEAALLAAKRELTTARAHLSAGYDRSEALFRIAGTIATMADDIYLELERKYTVKVKKARVTE
ncbi:MAG: hypothetical protein PHU46_09740 [Rhodocyclaceae bacterium]|nr:hypothetical protein [Rhodocyclaceae bacterium]